MGGFVVIYLLIITFFVINDIIPAFNEKRWKEFYLYSALFGFSFLIDLLIILQFKLPTPAAPIRNLIIYIMGLQD